MRDLLAKSRYNPNEKMKQINDMVGELFNTNSTALADWGIKIDCKPLELETRRLAQPALVHNQGNDDLFVTERLLKSMPVYNADSIQKRQLVLMHDNRGDRNEIRNVQETLLKCQGQMGMKTDAIDAVGFDYPRNAGSHQNAQAFQRNIQNALQDYMDRQGIKDGFKDLTVLFIVNYEQDYHEAKKVFAKLKVISQVIQRRNCRKFNLSIASNIMKQVNQKTGGEHIRVKLPEFMYKSPTMVIGIDVCHAGKNSTVGFAASTNVHCSSYFSDVIIQAKNQELVKKDLDNCLRKALQSFRDNVGQFPHKIVVFRDGVGEQQRTQILDKEIFQFREVIESYCNKVQKPELTLIVVNKRINQRIFLQNTRGFENPQPGTIIDSKLVENDNGNKSFDYFMVNQQTT